MHKNTESSLLFVVIVNLQTYLLEERRENLSEINITNYDAFAFPYIQLLKLREVDIQDVRNKTSIIHTNT